VDGTEETATALSSVSFGHDPDFGDFALSGSIYRKDVDAQWSVSNERVRARILLVFLLHVDCPASHVYRIADTVIFEERGRVTV
jgi:hypothetical protein